MFDFWLDYRVFPYDKIQSIISPLLWNISGFNILLSQQESLFNPFPSDQHITDHKATKRVSKSHFKFICCIESHNSLGWKGPQRWWLFWATFIKCVTWPSFHPLLNPPRIEITEEVIGEKNITAYNIVDLLARINFAFLWSSKNIMLESEIIELSGMSVGSHTNVSTML